MEVHVNGIGELVNSLSAMSQARFDAVAKVSAANIYNRGQAGGTPVDSGELRQSMQLNVDDASVGYTKEYAPHVEYGHRTRNGGYVAGQSYLQKNVAEERQTYIDNLKENIRRIL